MSRKKINAFGRAPSRRHSIKCEIGSAAARSLSSELAPDGGGDASTIMLMWANFLPGITFVSRQIQFPLVIFFRGDDSAKLLKNSSFG